MSDDEELCDINALPWHLVDAESQKLIEKRKTADTIPTVKDVVSILSKRARVLEAMSKPTRSVGNVGSASGSGQTKNRPDKYGKSLVAVEQACRFCVENHWIANCEKFSKLAWSERMEWVAKNHLCRKCFGKHFTNKCNQRDCKICRYPHHVLLHKPKEEVSASESKPSTSYSESSKSTALKVEVATSDISNQSHDSADSKTLCLLSQPSQVLLSTAIIWVRSSSGARVPCRVLVDSASQTNFITENLCQILNIKKGATNWAISGIGDSATKSKFSIQVQIESRLTNYEKSIECLVLPSITGLLPSTLVHCNRDELPESELGDPRFYKPNKVDMLVGAEVYSEIMQGEKINISSDLPPFMSSLFGYLACGKVPNSKTEPSNCQNNLSFVCCNVDLLNQQIQKFWTIDNLHTRNNFSLEEKACEQFYAQNCTRLENGKYCVALPTKLNIERLGGSKESALRQFHSLEKRLIKDPSLYNQYRTFLNEYIELGHMSRIDATGESNPRSFFMPHHAVVKESSSTTKLRVVFNASAKTNSDVTLNDVLMTGPTIQPDLFSQLIRFRTYRIALTADIAKMYRQVLVRESDRPLQQIFWRNSVDEPVSIYQLNTITYGTACAPFLAIRTLKQLAYDEYEKFPEAASILLNNFYVDDLLVGSDDRDHAIKLKDELTSLLSLGGFDLRKWRSNESQIISDDAEPDSCTLGVHWDTRRDLFQLEFKTMSINLPFTKRAVLAQITQFFDPMGLANPVIFKAKVYMQKLWATRELNWDDFICQPLSDEWLSFATDLNSINPIQVPRCVKPGSDSKCIELHGFGDASEKGYGACIYIRSCDANNQWQSQLLCAKSKVAPLKKQTIPRLELCAALLLSQLFDKVKSGLDIKFDKVRLYSDSEITLFRINSAPSKYATFVANRISEIQDISHPSLWSHIPTHLNPADLVSRGIMPSELESATLWWNGPEFLCDPEDCWPLSSSSFRGLDDPEMVKANTSLAACEINAEPINLCCTFSNYTKMIRISAYCLRYIKNRNLLPEDRTIGELTAHDLECALNGLIKFIQYENFNQELKQLKSNQSLKKTNPLAKLCPFVDKDGILRVGGRLANSELSHDQIHPILLPSKHNFCRLLIKHEHIKNLHVGPQALLSFVRQKFWVLGGRVMCKQIVFECIRCFRTKPSNLHQLMGQLPPQRVRPHRPFENVGIDFCGPFYITNKIRSNVVYKSYICVFVCFSTKATHLEVVHDLSTSAFIAALRRFCGRRGKCTNMYTDNATNFVGSRRELQELQRLFDNETHKIEVLKHCSNEGITVHTIPARSPHFGGLWEAAVKSAKNLLKRELGTKKSTLEELTTLVIQIEACLNSRPLTPMSNDPSDYTALTPGHFLIGAPLNLLPEPSVLHLDFNRLSRYQRMQYTLQKFWQRWSNEYLCELQHRHKWKASKNNIEIGALVLLKEDNLPPIKWIMGRVMQTHPGSDNLIRVVTVKTPSGVFKRAINRICMLPLETAITND